MTEADSGHAEFTATVRGEVPEISLVFSVLRQLRDMVLAGQWIEPRSAYQIGCRTLRVIARDDGTLGLEETVAPGVWQEQVDETITDLHNQILVGKQLGLAQSWGEMTELHRVVMHRCAATADTIALSRHAPEDEGASGWHVICMDKHEDDEVVGVQLGQVMADFPYLRQFLALPAETTVVMARPQRPDGVVRATVRHNGNELTAGRTRFGPEPTPRTPVRARNALLTDGKGLTWTTVGKRSGLPEIAARTVLPAPDDAPRSGWAALVLDELQDAIAEDTRFEAGQTVRSGWRTLRFISRSDGMLGLEERTVGDNWAEQIDLTLRERWAQQQVVAGLGPQEWTTFPLDTQHSTVTDCVEESDSSVLLFREATDNPTHSGWTLTCTRSHEHGAGRLRTLWDLTESLPFVTRFLALPRAAEVLIDTPRGLRGAEIRASVRIFGNELVPEPGSYTAELLGLTD
ncbi:hypothetical protein K7711_09340 [Nocardia sp. CA2R105]|uniref:immunity protein Imm33 domain-containing protein n=1 Tax=Nocardia coffeae TaxID=2873381 RepID=UPI001CA79905|nr:hypothetical protein [Nocardia coffeae]MBY8856677.1 hypothetical protein [Nocardia coffeae]